MFNKIKPFFLKRGFRFFIILFSLTLILILNLFKLLLLPKEISIIEGKAEKFEFNIPAQAVILSTDKTDINLNNKQLNSKDKISLSKPFSLSSNEAGTAKISLRFLGVPVKEVNLSVLPDIKLVPCGKTIGVRINTDGIMVLGTGAVKNKRGESLEPCSNILKPGDLILKADENKTENKEELIKAINDCKNLKLKLTINRNSNILEKEVNVVKGEDDENKIGVWVRDSTQGIGTLTYYNPKTHNFGALGHGITDVDTSELMTVKSGRIMSADVYDVKKGKKGSPGELLGNINRDNVLGEVFSNTEFGIYGKIDNEIGNGNSIPIALSSQVKEGPVEIISCIEGEESKSYSGKIININRYNINSSKSMVIKITDENLLSKTNGIVQGMSGSPIIQDGKLIGAVTHVFVNEPDKGYGIFIENMLKQEVNK